MADPTTLFAVARGTTVLTGYRTSVDGARSDLRAVESSMRQAFLEPDVQLVTVEQTTSYSDPVPYVEQTVVVDEPVTEPTDDGHTPDDEPADGETPDDSEPV